MDVSSQALIDARMVGAMPEAAERLRRRTSWPFDGS
jgi:hypothetical protein